MSTHAGAMLIAAMAYTYARRHAHDDRFVFGTGKLGDLAGYTSAIVLAIIALLIGYEAVARFLSPVRIHFAEAIPIAAVGLLVNVVSAWLLSDGEHEHGHEHGQGHAHTHAQAHANGEPHDHPHRHEDLPRTEHERAPSRGPNAAHRDNNIRSAYIHVMADAAVSVLAIVGLTLARIFGWNWMDPLAGIVGAVVIASWSYRLMRDTAGILLDVNPDRHLTQEVRAAIESGGDRLLDLHLWRLGPGHLGAVISVVTGQQRDCDYYRSCLSRFPSLSHVTVEVISASG